MNTPHCLFIGFTGHRNLEPNIDTVAAISKALGLLAAGAAPAIVTVSSGAEGADLHFAEDALVRGLPWWCVLPYALEVFEEDLRQAGDRDRLRSVVSRAAAVTVASTAAQRDEAHRECGYRIVDECDILIAFWDGKPAGGPGGTGDVVAYAKEQGRPVLRIDAKSGSHFWDGTPPAEVQQTAPKSQIGQGVGGRACVERWFQEHDAAARRSQPLARHINVGLIFLHQIATAAAVAGLVWAGPPGHSTWIESSAPWVKVLALTAALFLPLLGHSAHHGWMHHRLMAEICRATLALWTTGRPEQMFKHLALPGFERFQKRLLCERWREPTTPAGLAEATATYCRDRIDAQIAYFNAQARKIQTLHTLLTVASRGFTVIALLLGVASLAHWFHADEVYKAAKFLSVSLPLAAAAFVGWVLASDLGRRRARYAELERQLRASRNAVLSAGTCGRLEQRVGEVERLLLLELWEWYTTAKFTSSQH